MKIKLDENLPFSLASRLSTLGHDVHTVRDERLIGRIDLEIWEAAQRDGRFLITEDLDFSDTRRFTPGTHHGVLLIRLRLPNRRGLLRRVEDLFRGENVSAWTGCFVVARTSKAGAWVTAGLSERGTLVLIDYARRPHSRPADSYCLRTGSPGLPALTPHDAALRESLAAESFRWVLRSAARCIAARHR